MSALTPQQKERQKLARARAGQIRFGMQNYIETLGAIAQARAEDDHLALGYETWAEYVDGEFGDGRLRLPSELRRKAIEELRLAGASQREIGQTLGVSQPTVSRVLNPSGDSNESPGADEGAVPPARSSLVEAMKGAIEGAQERAQDHRSERPGDEADVPVQPSAAGPESGPPTGSGSPNLPVEAGEEASGSAAAGESAAGPGCEKCGGPIRRDDWVGGFMRCNDCDPHGAHIANGDGCYVCVPASCPTCGQPLPT